VFDLIDAILGLGEEIFPFAVLVTLALMGYHILKSVLPKMRAKADELRANQSTSLHNLKRLESLASLRDSGAITSAEFEAEKAKIMR